MKLQCRNSAGGIIKAISKIEAAIWILERPFCLEQQLCGSLLQLILTGSHSSRIQEIRVDANRIARDYERFSMSIRYAVSIEIEVCFDQQLINDCWTANGRLIRLKRKHGVAIGVLQQNYGDSRHVESLG